MKFRRWFRAVTTAGQGVVSGIDEAQLAESAAGTDPLGLFDRWYREAQQAGIYLHEAMTLATATPDGAPSARQVLLKSHVAGEFTFYTNYESRKARELEANPRAALLFHWSSLHRQIRIEGAVRRTSPAESAAYHASRPRGSRIGAWASQQSREIGSRALLEEQFRARETEFASGEVPLPPFWGGYVVVAEMIEFWQGRTNRLHDRLLFRRTADGSWSVCRLCP